MKRFVYALIALMGYVHTAQAQYLVQREIFPNFRFSAPTEFIPLPGRPGKVAIAYQGGLIRIFNLDSVDVAPTTLLDATSLTRASGEMGLLGLAFHPSFPQDSRIFVNYVEIVSGSARNTKIASFTVDTTTMTADVASRVELMTVSQPFTNHKGGKLEFGPDGMLYIALGDGGSGNDPGNRAQNLNTWLGKILRIDVNSQDAGLNYAVPADNPYADSSATAYKREIYASGLRNPWKFNWDFQTNRLWVSDVGQSAYEEVDTVVSGGNYGWVYREGAHCNSTPTNCALPYLIDPVWEYGRSLGISTTGGFVYRGTAIPFLVGQYVYGDYGSGRVWGLAVEPNGITNVQLLQSRSQGTNPVNITTFGKDHEGELYILHGTNGAVYKLEVSPTATRPGRPAALNRLTLNPNPATDRLTVELNLDRPSPVKIKAVSAEGRIMGTLYNATQVAAGSQRLSLSTQALPAGSYVIEVITEDGIRQERLAVVR